MELGLVKNAGEDSKCNQKVELGLGLVTRGASGVGKGQVFAIKVGRDEITKISFLMGQRK